MKKSLSGEGWRLGENEDLGKRSGKAKLFIRS